MFHSDNDIMAEIIIALTCIIVWLGVIAVILIFLDSFGSIDLISF